MPKKPGKLSSTDNSAFGLAVKKSKAKKEHKKFDVLVDGAGQVTIQGRPEFNTRARQLMPKAQKSEEFDRRHLVHFDEEIKPYGSLVIEKVIAKYGAGAGGVMTAALASRGCARLPTSDRAILKRLISEVNSSIVNLVPDDAAINKAIEVVRGNLRKLRTKWVYDPDVQRIYSNMDTSNYHQSTKALKMLAKSTLLLSGAGTDILRAVQAINKDMITMIDGAADAHHLFTLFGDMENSVTFDISSKASREKIEFANQWRREREMLETNARSGEDNADELLAHLASLIEHY